MKSRGDWYFDGYEARSEVGPDGRVRKELIYTGEYYGFARQRNPRSIKLACVAADFIYLAAYIFCAMNSSATARIPWIGIPLMLSMAPGIYLLIGLVCFLPAKKEMTARVCFSSLRRMDRALRVMVPMAVIWLGGCLLRMVQAPQVFTSSPDLLYILGAILAAAASCFQFILLRKNPVIIVRDPQPESLRYEELQEIKRKKQGRKNKKGNIL